MTHPTLDPAFARVARAFADWEGIVAQGVRPSARSIIGTTPPLSVNGIPEFDGAYSDFSASNTLYQYSGPDGFREDRRWLDNAKAAGQTLCAALGLDVEAFSQLDFQNSLNFLKIGLMTYLTRQSGASEEEVRNYFARRAFNIGNDSMVVAVGDSLTEEIGGDPEMPGPGGYRNDGHFSYFTRGLSAFFAGEESPVLGTQERPGGLYPVPAGVTSNVRALLEMGKASMRRFTIVPSLVPVFTSQGVSQALQASDAASQTSGPRYAALTVSGFSWNAATARGLKTLATGLPLAPFLIRYRIPSVADYPNAVAAQHGRKVALYMVTAHNDDLFYYLWERGKTLRDPADYEEDTVTMGEAYLSENPTGTFLMEAPVNIAVLGLETLGKRFFDPRTPIFYTKTLVPGQIVKCDDQGLEGLAFDPGHMYANPVYTYALHKGQGVARSAFFNDGDRDLLYTQYLGLKQAQERAAARLGRTYPQARVLITDINPFFEQIVAHDLCYALGSGDKLHRTYPAYAALTLVRLENQRRLGLPVDLTQLRDEDPKGFVAMWNYYGVSFDDAQRFVRGDLSADALIATIATTMRGKNIPVQEPDTGVAMFGFNVTAMVPVPGVSVEEARRLWRIVSLEEDTNQGVAQLK